MQNTGVTRSAVTQSTLSGYGVVWTKCSHQVTACTLMHKDCNHYENTTSLPEGFHSWRQEIDLQYPQFKYWSVILSLEFKLLSFLKPVRGGNFSLYKNDLKQLTMITMLAGYLTTGMKWLLLI